VKEARNPSVATVYMVADRVVKKMDQSPSREAIEACLDLAWLPTGRSASLDDPDVRMGILDNVISRLKQEIDWLATKGLP
jgi:hypothetical protein